MWWFVKARTISYKDPVHKSLLILTVVKRLLPIFLNREQFTEHKAARNKSINIHIAEIVMSSEMI